MNTRTKIALDRALGILVAYPLNLLVRLVGQITRFDHSLTKDMQKIVVCKFKGMGSIIQATPLLQTLRKRYPNAEIVFVSSIENKGILEKIDLLNAVYLIDDRKFFRFLFGTFRLVIRLMRFRADLYIDLEIYSNFSSIITTWSMARDRFGYYLRSNRYRMGMYTHMMYFNTKAPIAEAYLQFARLLNIQDITSHLLELKHEPLEKVSIPEQYIVINPNASDLRYERRWPATSFIALIERILTQDEQTTIVLIGSKNEQAYVSHISTHFQQNRQVMDHSGKTNLTELTELLRAARLVITNDTGPMHLASSLKTPVLALFGPCAPQQYGLGPNVKSIYKNVYCSPCVHEFIVPPCKGNNQCMQLISVDEVFDAYTNYALFSSSETIIYDDHENNALGMVVR